MKTAKRILLGVAGILLIGSIAYAAVLPLWVENVPGGTLARLWVGGFNTPSQVLTAVTVPPDSGALYNNPSGDHTVGVAVNAIPDQGGICFTVTDPGPSSGDYTWEGWMYTGQANTRRGLLVRVNPAGGITQGYMFVLESGGFTIRFRKLTSETVVRTMKQWLATDAGWPGAIPQNTWIKLKVECTGDQFRCFISGPNGEVELPGGPVQDVPAANEPPQPFLNGWVGCYNFRFDLGGVPVFFDDLTFSADPATPASTTTFGGLKAKYRR